MVGELHGCMARPGRTEFGVLRQRLCDNAMQASSLARQQRLVDRFSQERVPEPEGVLVPICHEDLEFHCF